ncbi:hypothetical protein [Rhodopirellula sallentina]|uniref:Uncharacterized protein n=1 Tax=Rhodopirellula sallentina SM41 TaxID=1263870 RepID=M5UE10_9BACT|nr:hypothetical protein [Rhodopirellula sallentina]EMI56096.1 hypothetical protein RSSM_02431 [Rhodopirellula sallentina SM41]
MPEKHAGPVASEVGSSGVDPSEGGCEDETYQEYRARGENKTALIVPPLSDAELLLKNNLSSSTSSSTLPRPSAAQDLSSNGSNSDFWDSLRDQARSQLLSDSRRYTSAYRDLPPTSPTPDSQSTPAPPSTPARQSSRPFQTTRPSDSATASTDVDSACIPIVMAGHQPTLFHPGVWFKNYALDRIARDTGAHAINLVIDNDVAASRSIRVPVRDALGRVRYQTVSYDVGGAGIPFEQAKIRDLRQFDRFDAEVRRTIAPLVSDPSISRVWPHARAAIRRCEIAGCALAQARHALEGELGWETLEIPLGVAVRGWPFARFVMEIADQAEGFRQVYNDAADHYRAWHGIRSNAHPVPNLARDGDWFELPLWVYGNDNPVRRPVWARRIGNQLELSDRESSNSAAALVRLPADNRDAAAAVLADAASPEFKLRPRALVTTMFARLVLSDLFIHGIGGGKYDQLADRIICQFFQQRPPAFEVVSATVRLPGQDRDPSLPLKAEKLHRQIRDTRYHGEKWLLTRSGEQSPLVQRKKTLLDNMPPKGQRSEWHHEMDSLNSAIAAELETERQNLQASLQRLRLKQTEEQILASRELSFCLFPIEELTSAFEQMLQ